MLRSMKLAVVALLLLAFAASTVEAAQHRGRRGRQHRWGQLGFFIKVYSNARIMKDAGVSKAKSNEILKIVRQAQKDIIPLQAKKKVEYINLREAINSQPINNEQVMAIAKKIHEIKWEIKQISLTTRLKILSMFTEPEREKLQAAIRKMFRERRR